jgi:hypothetical protein
VNEEGPGAGGQATGKMTSLSALLTLNPRIAMRPDKDSNRPREYAKMASGASRDDMWAPEVAKRD